MDRMTAHIRRTLLARVTAPIPPTSKATLEALDAELAGIERHLRRVEATLGRSIVGVDPDWLESARNLVHYIALRQLDLRELQLLLQQHGLSSLGRSESFVMASLLEVRMRIAESLQNGDQARQDGRTLEERRMPALSGQTAEFLLHAHTRAAFGAKPSGRHVAVMVTAPSAAEAEREWLARLLRAGMNLLRINCAHEGPAEWRRIIDALEAARRETGLECRVLMDLGGPKIRTGPIRGARVATWKLERDAYGRVVTPALIVLRPRLRAAEPTDGPVLLVDEDRFARIRKGDELRLRDARGRRRRFTVCRIDSAEAMAETSRRAYVVDGTRYTHRRRARVLGRGRLDLAGVSSAAIDVAPGDALVLTGRAIEGRGACGKKCAIVSCTVPEALRGVAVGHRVLFDDGKIESVITRVQGADLHLRVLRTSRPVVRLRAEKGINLPDSPLPIGALTDDDRSHLDFVADHADLVGLSFVRSPADVIALHEALGQRSLGIVLKIETKTGFEHLPRILLEAMRRPPVAVMIARGDLAVEVGFERLAELQEEILWLCEASHVPAIWATEVLDRLARTGVPSRAEVTDAAASVAAECVMLNKGPHVEEAVRALVDILRRMEGHHYKKRSIFRKLRVSNWAEPRARPVASP
jgi:pyruvate kinase